VKTTSLRRAIVPGIAVLTLALTGCGAGNETNGDDTGDSAGVSGTLNAGGASSQEKAQAAWRAGFQTENSGATVNYDPVGSGTGRENFISKAYSFAGTDSALNNDEGELDAAKERCGGEDVIQVPAYVSPIAVMFNLGSDVTSLNMSGKVIAEIFDGKITNWNDPAIAADNDGVELPDLAITPVHRQDDSGTTENFTKYLEAAGEGAWTHEPDGLWPEDVTGGEAAEGTSGVVGAVTDGEGTIGYADNSAVGDLGVVSVKVGSEFNPPSAEGAAKVVAISPAAGTSDVDMAVDLARDTTESGAYPVILESYLIACQHYDSEEEADLVKEYLAYIVSDEGQQAAASEAGSAPLEASVAEKAQGIVDKIAAS